MILLGSTLNNAPVMSLHTGGEIARTTEAVIDPADLTIIAYKISSRLVDKPTLVRVADIRELSDIGMIVDSIDEFVSPDDVVNIKKICDLGFHLVGMQVRDEKRNKLGKVIDFTLETTTFTVQQLTVKRPMFQSLNDTELLIHRTQIVEINNDGIVVHSQAKAPEPERSEVIGSYVNPFRKSKPAAESIKPHQD